MEELDEILTLFETAKDFMRKAGNPYQWGPGYPPQEVIARDIENGNFYVEEREGKIVGCFAFITGDDPTYSHIDGKWLNDLPYGTIHRLASDGTSKGFGSRCIAFCRNLIPNLRADTHEANLPMRRILLRNLFAYCGIITASDGTPRLAFQQMPQP